MKIEENKEKLTKISIPAALKASSKYTLNINKENTRKFSPGKIKKPRTPNRVTVSKGNIKKVVRVELLP